MKGLHSIWLIDLDFQCDLLVILTFCDPSFHLPEEVKGQSLGPKQLEARSAV